jgi:hypothetical protein
MGILLSVRRVWKNVVLLIFGTVIIMQGMKGNYKQIVVAEPEIAVNG